MPVVFCIILCWITLFSFQFLPLLQLRSSVSSSGFIECFCVLLRPLPLVSMPLHSGGVMRSGSTLICPEDSMCGCALGVAT
jgi:hypothetical protein